MDSLNVRLCNAPKMNEDDKRLIGFVINKNELNDMGIFSHVFEKYCVLFLQGRGYTVKKEKE